MDASFEAMFAAMADRAEAHPAPKPRQLTRPQLSAANQELVRYMADWRTSLDVAVRFGCSYDRARQRVYNLQMEYHVPIERGLIAGGSPTGRQCTRYRVRG